MVANCIPASNAGDHSDKRVPQQASVLEMLSRGFGRNLGRRKTERHDEEQIAFLKEMYERGVTGVPVKPMQAEALMRERFPRQRQKWLTEMQIKSWFGSLRQKLKKAGTKHALQELRQTFNESAEEIGCASKDADAQVMAADAAKAEESDCERNGSSPDEESDCEQNGSDPERMPTEPSSESSADSSSDDEVQVPLYEQTLLTGPRSSRSRTAHSVPAKFR